MAALLGGSDMDRIQVYARVRPLLPREHMGVAEQALAADAVTRQVSVSTPESTKPLKFQFDAVLPSSSTQEDAFSLVQPQLKSCLEGYNVTVFA